MAEIPAFVRDGRLDVLAVNALGAALYAPVFDVTPEGRVPATARFDFLDPRAHGFRLEWGPAAAETVALLRTQAGRDPYDTGLSDLVGELSTCSEDVRIRWADHRVRLHRAGFPHVHHPVVGELHLGFEDLQLPTGTGLTLTACTAEAGSRADGALRLLAGWAAGRDPTHVAR